MLAAPRAETVRESEKVFLIDRVEDCDRGRLDDFVLQGRDPQRALPPVWFLDVLPSRWLRSVCSAMDPTVEIDKSLFQSSLILVPRDAVYARSVFSMQGVTAFP